jgi:Pyridoxamine 5'-phosphate oxidase
MELSAEQLAFLEANHSAAMIVVRRDGAAHAVRMATAVVDGRIWSSGTQDRLRTRLLRRDPRSTLFVFGSGQGYLTLECGVTLIEGPDVPELSVRLFQTMQAAMQPPPPPGHLMWFGKPLNLDDFRKTMVDERRLIYQFEVNRAYGLIV